MSLNESKQVETGVGRKDLTLLIWINILQSKRGNSIKEMFHNGIMLNEETLFMSWWRSAVKEVYDWDPNICNMSPDFRLYYTYEIWFQDMALASSD